MARPKAAARRSPASDVAAQLSAAFESYRAGRLDEAEQALEAIAASQPRESNALHLLGVVKLSKGDVEAAAALLARAAKIEKRNPQILNNLGSAYRRLGRANDAESSFRKAIAAKPDFAEAYFNLGNTLFEAGNAVGALDSYRRADRIRGNHVATLTGIGRCADKANQPDEAERAWRAVLAAAPGHPEATIGLGIVLAKQHRPVEAESQFRSALALDEGSADAHVNLGNVLCTLDKDDEALIHFLKALEIDANCVEAMLGIGNIAERKGELAEAAAIYRRTIETRSDFAPAHNNLGTVLAAQCDYEAARAAFQRAIELLPDYADAHGSFGHMLMGLGEYDDAMAHYDHVLAHDPDHADTRMNRATLRLLRGEFADGWTDYLWRNTLQSVGEGVHREPLPANLSGKRIMLLPDQGLGDEIFFLRFVGLLRERGAAFVAFRPDAKIASMIGRAGLIDEICGPGEAPRDIDLTLSVGDLPYLLGMGDDDPLPAPAAIPPLEDRLVAMRARLEAAGPRPWLGVTWRAGTKGRKRGLFKSIPMDRLAAAMKETAGTVFVLQRLPKEGEIETFAQALGREAHDFTSVNDDLESMLALVAQLDDYICASNTNLYLRTGTGAACRALIPNPPEIRWMLGRRESPWFPGTIVYREIPRVGWDEAMAQLAADLGAAWPKD